MNCFLALSLPDFVLQAIVFSGIGEKAEQPWIVVSAPAPLGRVLAASEPARRHGIAAGQNEVEALALAPGLLVRPRSPEAELHLRHWLADQLDQVSPRVQRLAAQGCDGALWLLDMAGLTRLRGPVLEQARRLRLHLRRHQLEARIGIASTGTAAVLAALAAGETAPPVWFLSAGREAQELGRLPLACLAHFPQSALPPSRLAQQKRRSKSRPQPAAPQWDEALALLDRWGLKTLGDLTCLPAAGLTERLGQLGALLQSIARGEECGLLAPYDDCLDTLQFTLEWDPPESDHERLLAAARARLEEIAAELARRDRVVERLTLHTIAQPHPTTEVLQLRRADEDRALRSRTSPEWRAERPLLVPARDLRGLASHLAAAFAARPHPLPLKAMTVRLILAAPRRIQPRLFEEANLDPGKLDRLLERLRELFHDPAGRRIGSPHLLDSWHPEAFALRPFALDLREPVPAGASGPDAGPEAVPLCLVRFRPPVPVRLRLPPAPEQPAPETLVGAECLLDGHPPPLRIVACAGPWRASGDWWSAAAWSRDEWDVELSNQGLYLLVHNRRTRSWLLEAAYS